MQKTVFARRIEEKIRTGDYLKEGRKKKALLQLFESIKKIKQNKRKIVFPEAFDERVLKAVEIIKKEEIAVPILVGEKTLVLEKARMLGISLNGIEIIPVEKHEKEFAELLYKIRKEKGISLKEAKNLAKNPVFFGALMVKAGFAHGMVAGASTSSDIVLRAALQVIKTKKEIKTVSGAFIMVLPHKKFGEKFLHRSVFLFADCAVNINPSEEQLAEIALQSAETIKKFGIKPRIAMLSYSTRKYDEKVCKTKMCFAEKIVKKSNPKLEIEEVQLDAAIDKTVAKIKNPKTMLKGRANVLIFPNLESGNIGYKLVERFAGAEAIGTILQGLAKPVNDLSRGCSIEDIVNVATITAFQASTNK